ncbi:hypothetical protein ACF0H5_015170 [Mactra antiquata]
MPGKYGVSSFDTLDENGGNSKMSGKEGGCYIKTATGFIITLLCIAIAVGAGLIVHFVENRKIECSLSEDALQGNNQLQGQTEVSTHATPSTTSTITDTKQTIKDVRLPRALVPSHYELCLQPEMYQGEPEDFVFRGHVKIHLDCTKPTDNVTLHINKLNVSNIVFSKPQSSGSSSPSYVTHTEDKDRHFLIIQLDKNTDVGTEYELSMDFVGPLDDDLAGLYLSSYKEGNETVYLATTHFEPTDARKAFPCFDEPDLKANFTVTLVRKNYLISLSNMPQQKSNNITDEYVEDIYQTSQKMSTYLLAFIVGKFSGNTTMANNSLKFGTWARPSSLKQIDLALEVGSKTIVNYADYFGVGFPLPKQDQIALPDFPSGAMENWGLITYRESAMLYDPEVSSRKNVRRIVTVITHELAHQWFGDLVTMKWWDDLWLNEGFASFVEYLGADEIYPEWKMFEEFVIDTLHWAFEFDSLVTSHPIYVPVDNPSEIQEIFDSISYDKGASIIRMMRFILGEETFKKGLKHYMEAHRYGNANHDDLWKALADQSKEENSENPVDVKRIMDTWTLQMNYPVVTIHKQAGKLRMVQKRFLKNEHAEDPGKFHSTYGYKWEIPFTYTTSQDPDFNQTAADIHWMTGETLEIENADISDEGWIIGNIEQYGYYRVNYDESNWKALIQQLKTKHEVISNINRAQIINDAWSLARADKLSTEIALNVLEYLDKELDYVPWVAAIQQIGYIDSMLRKTDVYGQFKAFMLSKVTDPYHHYGMNETDSNHIESLIRSDLVSLACEYGLPECIQDSKVLFNKWMENPKNNPIDPDLRSTVYCTAVAEGDEEEWNFVYEKYKAATVVTEKITLSKALACTKSTWLLSRYLELTVTPDIVRKQDATKTMVYIANNPVGEPLVWDFVRGRWDYLFNTYGSGTFSFKSLISGITSSFNTEFQLKQLKQFLKDNPNMGTGSRAFLQAIEKTETNFKWMESNKVVISDWLDKVGVSQNTAIKDVRLPTHLIPDSYEIKLRPNMYYGEPENFNFTGSVKIYMTANDTGRNVTLHVNKLNIDEDSIKFGTIGNYAESPKYNGQRHTDKLRQFEIFYLDKDIIDGVEYYIEMTFSGPLVGDLAGLYLSEYKRNNDTVYIATTQFEATDARRAFPCFDEPALKAVFNITLERIPSMVSLSNMPITSMVNLTDGFVQDVYQESVKMSTYLLAFIVCDFQYVENTTKNNVTYRAWSRPESINQTKVALETGVKVLTFYEEYFGHKFPLPKQDMIAIPDFAAGAMENWGLITYRETDMLYEPGVSSEGNLQRVKVVIAHELAHQWFGDLVTMEWWDDIWLNEGFASFVEHMGVDEINKEYKMFEQFVFMTYNVFDVDSLKTSHPISVEAYTPDEIDGLFDTISYDKGGCVIRMMRFFLGEETFKLGLQNYLEDRKFANADHNDLWDALEAQAKKDKKTIDVRKILDTWVLQMNYPVVTISKDTKGKIVLTQKRFLKDENSDEPEKYVSPYNYQWKIPVTYTTSKNTTFNHTDADVIWLDEKEKVTNEVYPSSTDDWIIGNILQYGVYRVNYDEQNWANLIKQLKTNHKVINVINRGQIINDAFGLAGANLLPMETALKTLEYLHNEEEYIPWVAAGSEIGHIHKMIVDTKLYGPFKKLMQETVKQQFDKLTMNNTGASHLTSYMRSEISSHACSYDIKQCVEESKTLIDEYMSNPEDNPVDPGLKSTVYCTAIREGNEEIWDFMYEKYLTATVQAEKSRLLRALSCTRELWLLNRWLERVMDFSIVRKQDSYRVFTYVARNTVGRAATWNFFRSNWDAIYEIYGSYGMSGIISGVTSSFNTEFQLQELKDFQVLHPNMGSGTRAFSQAIENTKTRIKWMKENYDILKEWLKQ